MSRGRATRYMQNRLRIAFTVGEGGGKKTPERHACALHTANAAGSSDDLFPLLQSFFLLVISREKKACSTSTGNILFFLSPPQRTVILFKCQARKAAWHLIAMLCSGTARQLELISASSFFFVCFFKKKRKNNTSLSPDLLRSPSSTTSRTSRGCRGTPGSTPWPSSSATTRPRPSPATQVKQNESSKHLSLTAAGYLQNVKRGPFQAAAEQ